MDTILVQASDYPWTMEALHLACGLARRRGTHITLLRLIPVQPHWLGTDFGLAIVSFHEWKNLSEYHATAEDYGVELVFQPMQYISFHDAVIQAVSFLKAAIAFVDIPSSSFSWWDRFRIRGLERRLAKVNCHLQTLHTIPRLMLPS
ncbi:MAG: hypothetical protein F9K27_07720 [Anaerolineae bacterium]|nr:MAG: hypothetical protein F9K27_07720 [Anaerolineae bacterium]